MCDGVTDERLLLKDRTRAAQQGESEKSLRERFFFPVESLVFELEARRRFVRGAGQRPQDELTSVDPRQWGAHTAF